MTLTARQHAALARLAADYHATSVTTTAIPFTDTETSVAFELLDLAGHRILSGTVTGDAHVRTDSTLEAA